LERYNLAVRRKPVVLIAEDNPDIRALTKILLESEGCRVIEAVDGRKALSAARCSVPDLILLDIQMPFMDGLQVTRRLRESDSTRHIPIVALSASHDKRREALEAGCSAFINKPLMPEAIREFLKLCSPQVGMHSQNILSTDLGRLKHEELVRSIHRLFEA
jgi:CheY-like chemotaxis protein